MQTSQNSTNMLYKFGLELIVEEMHSFSFIHIKAFSDYV